MEPIKITKLWSIEGEELSGVCFVRDYVEFHFDGPVLRALSHPAVAKEPDTVVTFPEARSRDVLCSLIGLVVKCIDVLEGDKIELTFEDGSILTVPLDEASKIGPEAAHFVPRENEPIEVW